MSKKFDDWLDVVEKRLVESGEKEIRFEVGKVYDEMAMEYKERFVKILCKERHGNDAVLEEVEINPDGSLKHLGVEYRGNIKEAVVGFEQYKIDIFHPTPEVIISNGRGINIVGSFNSRHKVSNKVYI